MSDRVLVVGYGSTLRTDDGVGPRLAERLADDPRSAGATVLARHQLTPELALDISRSSLVILIDAQRDLAAGSSAVQRVDRSDGARAWSHHLTPASLVGLTAELYGRVPEVILVSVGVASLETGDRLSPAVEAALPALVDDLVALMAGAIGRPSSASTAGVGHA